MILIGESTDADALRVRNEFLVDPHLEMSVEACSRLLAIHHRHAAVILETLVEEGFLDRTSDGRYIRR
jgi:DNA-binding IclR family transcriptional regulator